MVCPVKPTHLHGLSKGLNSRFWVQTPVQLRQVGILSCLCRVVTLYGKQAAAGSHPVHGEPDRGLQQAGASWRAGARAYPVASSACASRYGVQTRQLATAHVFVPARLQVPSELVVNMDDVDSPADAEAWAELAWRSQGLVVPVGEGDESSIHRNSGFANLLMLMVWRTLWVYSYVFAPNPAACCHPSLPQACPPRQPQRPLS